MGGDWREWEGVGWDRRGGKGGEGRGWERKGEEERERRVPKVTPSKKS